MPELLVVPTGRGLLQPPAPLFTYNTSLSGEKGVSDSAARTSPNPELRVQRVKHIKVSLHAIPTMVRTFQQIDAWSIDRCGHLNTFLRPGPHQPPLPDRMNAARGCVHTPAFVAEVTEIDVVVPTVGS